MAGGIGVTFTFNNRDAFDKAIDELIATADTAAKAFVVSGGLLIEAAAKERAPVLTGTLRRSIHVGEVTPLGLGRWQSRTYPSTVYSRRIELGFHGNDSQGRHYDQAAQPYLQPGLDSVMDDLHALHESLMVAALEA